MLNLTPQHGAQTVHVRRASLKKLPDINIQHYRDANHHLQAKQKLFGLLSRKLKNWHSAPAGKAHTWWAVF